MSSKQPEPGDLVGTILDGRYQVLELIDAGERRVIYKARHQLMDRLVEIRILPRELASNPDNFQDFQQEYLSQSSTVVGKSIHDFGVLPDGRPYIATQFPGEQDDSAIEKQAGDKSVQQLTKTYKKWFQSRIRIVILAEVALLCAAAIWLAFTDSGSTALNSAILYFQNNMLNYDDSQLFSTRWKLAFLELKQHHYQKAHALYEKILPKFVEQSRDQPLDAIHTLQNIAEMADSTNAEDASQQGSAESLKVLMICTALELDASYNEDGKIPESDRLYQQFKKLIGQSTTLATADKARMFAAAGSIYYLKGKNAKSTPYLEDYRSILSQAGQPPYPALLEYLANCYSGGGAYKKAEEIYSEELSIKNSQPKVDKKSLANLLQQIACNELKLDQLNQANLHFNQAVDTCESISPPDLGMYKRIVRDFSVSLARVGTTQYYAGLNSQAKPYLQRYREVLNKAEMKKEADVLQCLGNCYEGDHDLANAYLTYKEAISVIDSKHKKDKDYRELTDLLLLAAHNASELSKLDQSDAYYKRALESCGRVHPPDVALQKTCEKEYASLLARRHK